MVEAERTEKGVTSLDVRSFISSLPGDDAEKFGTAVRDREFLAQRSVDARANLRFVIKIPEPVIPPGGGRPSGILMTKCGLARGLRRNSLAQSLLQRVSASPRAERPVHFRTGSWATRPAAFPRAGLSHQLAARPTCTVIA